jgi:hypothetical protein
VAKLIHPVSGSWDEDLVLQTFLPQDAELILVTLVHTDLEDLVAGTTIQEDSSLYNRLT